MTLAFVPVVPTSAELMAAPTEGAVELEGTHPLIQASDDVLQPTGFPALDLRQQSPGSLESPSSSNPRPPNFQGGRWGLQRKRPGQEQAASSARGGTCPASSSRQGLAIPSRRPNGKGSPRLWPERYYTPVTGPSQHPARLPLRETAAGRSGVVAGSRPSYAPEVPKKKSGRKLAWQDSLQSPPEWFDRHHVTVSAGNGSLPGTKRSYFDNLPMTRVINGQYFHLPYHTQAPGNSDYMASGVAPEHARGELHRRFLTYPFLDPSKVFRPPFGKTPQPELAAESYEERAGTAPQGWSRSETEAFVPGGSGGVQ